GGLALARAAALAGAAGWRPERDERGAPRPSAGWHWTNTNTRGLAAALVAPVPVGIDAEWAHRPRFEAARARFDRDDPGELARAGGRDREHVLLLWTAKEAVLKLTRAGIADLGRTSLTAVLGGERLRLESRGEEYEVRALRWNAHLIAVAYPPETSPAVELVALEGAEG
ncbi:MAG: 4'-phosphopantetheinyl transferase superfamily protein, partial [Planctomycetota bacterium]